MSDWNTPVRRATHSGGLKSISDDDHCSDCRFCNYNPGDMSRCHLGWPGRENADGYVVYCTEFIERTSS